MNSGLDKIRGVDAEKLDSVYYFQSLLEQAYSKELLSDNDIERLRFECLTLLAYKTERYNSGDSSCIRIEKAQDIMTSNLFTIGLWLKTYPHPDDAITALRTVPINELYKKGRGHIDTMLASAKTIHARLMRRLIDTPNVFYSSTIDGGIKGFFKLYYPDFAAHEIHITADYPTFNPMPKLAGIEFIRSYLNSLYYENLFCSYFMSDDINHLLCGHAENYAEQLINIYEPVLLAALGCTIAGIDLKHLDITEYGAAYLCRQLADMSQNEIAATIQKAVSRLVSMMDCPQGLVQYIQGSLPCIILEIQKAVSEQTLNQVFALPSFPENKPKMIVSFGDKMDNEQYRKIIEEIAECRYSDDKAAIIKAHIHSLADLEDVLLDANLTGQETQSVLRMLDLPEIAAISKRYMLIDDIDTFELREQEQIFRKNLQDFISALPQSEQNMIAKLSTALQE